MRPHRAKRPRAIVPPYGAAPPPPAHPLFLSQAPPPGPALLLGPLSLPLLTTDSPSRLRPAGFLFLFFLYIHKHRSFDRVNKRSCSAFGNVRRDGVVTRDQ